MGIYVAVPVLAALGLGYWAVGSSPVPSRPAATNLVAAAADTSGTGTALHTSQATGGVGTISAGLSTSTADGASASLPNSLSTPPPVGSSPTATATPSGSASPAPAPSTPAPGTPPPGTPAPGTPAPATPTPAPTAGVVLFVEITALPGSASVASQVTLDAATLPGASCTAKVNGHSGKASLAPGLKKKQVADASGNVAWVWIVDPDRGTATATVACKLKGQSASKSKAFVVL